MRSRASSQKIVSSSSNVVEQLTFHITSSDVDLQSTVVFNESYPVRTSLFIVLTEETILGRYIKLIADESESDEIADLQNAITVVSELRESNLIGYVAPEFVA
jgi:hypothetical protein